LATRALKKNRVPKNKGKAATAKPRRFLKAAILVICSLLFLPVIEVVVIRFVDPPTTTPIILFKIKSGSSSVRYQWKSLPEMPLVFLKHCLVAEDQRFFQHHGFDWREIEIARRETEQTGNPARGASTITMQCARSLFLWQGRSWMRKGLEAYYTVLMETFLSKKRILELYANVIEMGEGIYGIEAGSQYYFGVPTQKLNREQSAMLVALLPHPKARNPKKPSPALLARQEIILRRENGFIFPTRLLHHATP
jgi:monofunctional biosynthetic peptidoglycan transglycosylase